MVAFVASLAGTAIGTSSASGAPTCALVVDASGDATVHVSSVTPDGAGKGVVPNDSSLDISTVDFGFTGRDLVAVVRTAGLVVSNPQSPLGQYFAVAFRIDGQLLVLDGVLTPLAQRAWLTKADGTNVGSDVTYPASIRADAGRRTVTLTVPLSSVGRIVPARRGTKLTTISAITQRVVGVTADNGLDAKALVGADKATTSRTYTIGSPIRC